MVSCKILLTCFVAVTSATQLHPDDAVFAALLKRQAPGTASYNCHDNCGTAITLSRQPNKCDLDAFKTNYNNCLQCAGPDNYNIWRMYGNTLSSAGSSCGLSTEPLPGKQPDVGPAVKPASSSGAASASASATPAPVSGSASAVISAATSAAASLSARVSSVASSVTGTNATASFTASAPPQQSTNAGAHQAGSVVGLVGAIVFGAMAGL
ncbi:hypothetical protein BKA63DRAFT_515601 [Paraphoma chrysanthemicola]|nr:hypothetical protein BKA63DRAFT_515601 [Paraphoma chrysanthemicola]